jgi:CRISPR-associated endonuclease/helicase Cas3
VSLTADDFIEFYQGVHNREPFHWQRDLVATVLRDGRWPDLVDVPTGLGKTSTLDVAVFVTGATADQPGAGRLGRRRCFLVVDRRVVVDEAYDHARKIAAALRSSDNAVVRAVAAGLRSLAPGADPERPLSVTRMRGGVIWDKAWLTRPDLPGLVVGTVDQVGSRLLFRGYGVSDRRRPIDAALVGTDALLLVDEAHLATALLETVRAVGQRDRLGLPLPGLDVVRLTATAGEAPSAAENRYVIDIAAHAREAAAKEPSGVEAMRRLQAPKELYLVETVAKTCPRVMADTALRLAGAERGARGWASSVLVVCNTVDRARAVYTLLDKAARARRGEASVDVDLLIGRSRPFDRRDLVGRATKRHGVDREPSPRPAVLVATQTVEVGVNLDVDALVTESAAWDALVQRLGRLDRLGRHGERFPNRAARAVVVHDGQADGPVYGAARDATWQRLRELTTPVKDPTTATGPGLPVSPLACRDLTASMPVETIAPRPQVPILHIPFLDAWATTSPAPTDDPPVAPFLHGFGTGAAGVTVAWRDDLAVADPLDDPFDDEIGAQRSSRVANLLLTAIPVRAAERVEVPFHAIRQWMRGQSPVPVSDVESAPEFEARSRQDHEPFQVLAWRSDPTTAESGTRTAGEWVWIDDERLRPGDQIVVPSQRGGLDAFGWDPTGTVKVSDVSEAAAFDVGRAVLRLDDSLGHRLGLDDQERRDLAAAIRALDQPDRELDQPDRELDQPDRDEGETVQDVLAAALGRLTAEQVASPIGIPPDRLMVWLRGTPAPELVPITDHGDDDRIVGGGFSRPHVVRWLLAGGTIPKTTPASEAGEDRLGRGDDDAASSSLSEAPVTLERHQRRVHERALRIAEGLGLPPDLVTVIGDAARWHDLGKAEQRFQAMLHGGDPHAAAVATEALAKSGLDPRDSGAWRAARARGGLPVGARHEAWSAALVQAYRAQCGGVPGTDDDLLIHLIASHHGHGRPWLPLVSDRAPRPVRAVVNGWEVSVPSERTVPLDQPARFARLNHRYGRWGLALLESIVRCADMTVSSEGS